MPPTQDRLIALTYLAGDVVHKAATAHDGEERRALDALAQEAKAALALPAPTAPKLLSGEVMTVLRFLSLNRAEDRERFYEQVRRTASTSGPLLIVLEYLKTV
jgi:hypothetical protein